MGIKFIKAAAIYLTVGIFMGMFMSISKNFTASSVHVHVLLLGWEVLALAGVVYCLFPKAGQTLLAKIQFWAHNIGFPVMAISLFLMSYRKDEKAPMNDSFEPVIALGSIVTAIAVLILVVNIFINVKESNKA